MQAGQPASPDQQKPPLGAVFSCLPPATATEWPVGAMAAHRSEPEQRAYRLGPGGDDAVDDGAEAAAEGRLKGPFWPQPAASAAAISTRAKTGLATRRAEAAATLDVPEMIIGAILLIAPGPTAALP